MFLVVTIGIKVSSQSHGGNQIVSSWMRLSLNFTTYLQCSNYFTSELLVVLLGSVWFITCKRYSDAQV